MKKSNSLTNVKENIEISDLVVVNRNDLNHIYKITGKHSNKVMIKLVFYYKQPESIEINSWWDETQFKKLNNIMKLFYNL